MEPRAGTDSGVAATSAAGEATRRKPVEPGLRQAISAAGRTEASSRELEGLVLAPVGRDAELIQSMLQSADIRVSRVDTAEALVARVEAEVTAEATPRIGVIIAADDALGIDWSARVASLLERQPSWSDLPLVLLARAIDSAGDIRTFGVGLATAEAQRLMSRGSVTVLDRPVRVAALVSAVRAALRARVRQIEVRDLIEALKRAQQQAVRAAAAKSEFLALMSHELRTPLNAISGYAELLSIGCYGPVTEQQLNVLNRVVQAQRHLLGIINDVLNLSKLEKGRVEYDIQPVKLRDVIAEVSPLIEPQLTAKQLEYEVHLPSDAVQVCADPEKLRQVILNLLSNAVKFTQPGGRISVDVDESDEASKAGHRVLVCISDTGSGIPGDKLEAVFEPFIQVRADAAIRNEGTGLGLAISRDLARGMGGDLSVRSELAKGSTFTIELRVP